MENSQCALIGAYGKFIQNSLHPGLFHALFCRLQFFLNQLFRKILSGIPSECQTDWIQVSFVRPDLDPNCLQKLSADVTRR